MSRDPAFSMAAQAAGLSWGIANALQSAVEPLLSFPQHDNRYSVAEVTAVVNGANEIIARQNAVLHAAASEEADRAALLDELAQRREADAERILDLENGLQAWQTEALRLRAEVAALKGDRQERRPVVSISAYRP